MLPLKMLLQSRMLRNIVIYRMPETCEIPFIADRLFALNDKFMYYHTRTISLEAHPFYSASADERHQSPFYELVLILSSKRNPLSGHWRGMEAQWLSWLSPDEVWAPPAMAPRLRGLPELSLTLRSCSLDSL